MNAVGIDVSKGKSTVTIRRPGDVVLMPPCDIPHTQSAINALIEQIKSLDGETKACMEHTGRYYEPVANWLSDAGIFVSAVNPILIRDFGDDSLRAPKTDKADSKKIAPYTLDRWAKLKQYGSMDKTRNQLKTMNRQFGFYMDQKTAMKNNLISLLDQTYPGANDFFDSPARSDGSQKWVDFVYTYWHVDCVRSKSLQAFTEHYQKWCKRNGYHFSASKAEKIYQSSSDLIAVFPKDDSTKALIRQAVTMLNTASQAVESLRLKMNQTATTLPEYPVVMAMNGVGPSLGPSLWLRLETLPVSHTEVRLPLSPVSILVRTFLSSLCQKNKDPRKHPRLVKLPIRLSTQDTEINSYCKNVLVSCRNSCTPGIPQRTSAKEKFLSNRKCYTALCLFRVLPPYNVK